MTPTQFTQRDALLQEMFARYRAQHAPATRAQRNERILGVCLWAALFAVLISIGI